MAPKDIRAFFKPAAKQSQPDASVDKNTRTHRPWPISRPQSHSGNPRPDAPTRSPFVGSVTHASPASQKPITNSQSSGLSTGSKKTYQDGEHMVLNSDSDSDLELLEELDFGLSKSTPQTKKPEIAVSPVTRSSVKRRDDGLPKPPKEVKSGTGAFSKLIRSLQEDAAAEKDMDLWKSVLEEDPTEPTGPAESTIDENLIEGVVDDKEGESKAKRLYMAMQRTNALDSDCVFHFFGETPDTESSASKPFPFDSLPSHGWASCFNDKWSREHAFMSGFAQQVFEYQELPEELASWVIDQVCFGRSNGLTAKYVELLQAHPAQLESLVNMGLLNNIFQKLGADTKILGKEVQPSFVPFHTPKPPVPHSLIRVLRLLSAAAKCLSPEPRHYALQLLLRICLDDSVIHDASALLAVQDAIESIIRYVPDRDPMLNEIVLDITSRISHPILQHTLVASLPTKSPLTAAFQRRLALSFVLSPTLPPAFDSDFSTLLHDHLNASKAFKVTKHTHYATLAASLSLLDIGIGPGPTPVPCQPPPADDSSPPETPLLTAEEIAFNKRIDALVQHIKLLGNRIVEAGAIADLTRLEAKDCVEKLVHRLESAARIGGRRKRGVFEDEEEVVRAGKRLFGRWIKRGKEKGAESAEGSGTATPAAVDGVDGPVL